jgi:hypothetical protein
MPDNAPPSRRSRPAIFTSVIHTVLAAAVLTGASLSGVAGAAALDLRHNAGSGRSGELLAEQRRQSQALERIERTIGRMQADIAVLKARIEARSPDQGAASAAPVDPASGRRGQGRLGQGNPRFGSSAEFDLGALRASFDAEAMTPGARAALRPHPRRVAKGGPAV